MNKQISEFVSAQEIHQWMVDLVSIPSYSGLANQEAEVGRYIKGVFDKEDIECHISPLRDGRCNVYATLHGTGGGKSLMFNGHMDTVPAYGMEKAFEPWTDANGKIHGRGTSDMKGPLAAMMAAVIAIKRSGVQLKGDVLYCAVADEEEGSLGTINMIEDGIRADAAIVGEPLGRKSIAISQKGLEWYQFDFKGRTVHGGAYKTGVNAIFKAVNFIDAVNERLAPELEKRALPIVGESTMNIGVIHGGTQLSTVAGECYVQLDRRFMPRLETYESCCGELQAILDDLAAQDPDFKCNMKVLESSLMDKGYVHQGFIQDVNDPFIQIVKRGLEKAMGREAELIGCPCWTDAGLISYYAKMPVVVYGPGWMEFAHSKEEYITLEVMEESYRAYINIAEDFCS